MKYIPQTEVRPLEELLAVCAAVTGTNWTLCHRAKKKQAVQFISCTQSFKEFSNKSSNVFCTKLPQEKQGVFGMEDGHGELLKKLGCSAST